MTPALLQQLDQLPDHWGLVAVDGQKRAYMPAWQRNPLTKAEAAAEITAGRAKAIGAIAGPTSGGLLFVDHDGISATAELERQGAPLRELPPSAVVTSGRDGRFQILYTIPEHHWPTLRSRRVFKTGTNDSEGKAENLDLRWHGHYSIVIGAHPQTTGYRWIQNRSITEQPIADAPDALISLLRNEPEPDPLPLLTTEAMPPPPVGTTVPLLDFVSRDTRELIESGGTPGSWNDDQLRMALDLRGTEQWIRSQGHSPDISASDAFALHVHAARLKARDFDERKAWHRFDGAETRNPHPSTPPDKLADRLRYHTRTTRPALPPPPAQQQQQQQAPPILTKAAKLEANELLYMLREQATGGQRIRWNTFHQQVEIDGAALKGSERFYLTLADQGFKVPKDLALDALIQVAHEHPYDPVRLYLEHVADTVSATYINALSTTYLRTGDYTASGEPSLYDHMIRCTLIAAVRRCFEPGCKHDTTCILAGDQGSRKSSFWSILGGPFYSNTLGDLSNKDDLLKLHRSWIMEWAELDSITSRKHAGQIKAFLTTQDDLFRAPYAKAVEPAPRRGIIVGTTNKSEGFLVDDTGNRRFWVVPCTGTEDDPIDTPRLAAERDAIWSGAVAAYRAGDASYLPIELSREVNRENASYLVDSPWREPIEAWLAAPKNQGRDITSEILLTEAVAKPVDRQTRSDQMQVGNIMRELGWLKRRAMVDGRQKWVFCQPPTRG
jgi:predicted P-loop ATPase